MTALGNGGSTTRWHRWGWQLVLAFWLGAAGMTWAQEKGRALAGWFDVYPSIKFGQGLEFQRTYQPLVVRKNDQGETVYSQTVRYEVATGLVRAFDFTLVGDPAVKVRYGAEWLRAQAEPPQEFKAGKYPGWSWPDGRMVVVLGESQAVVIAKAPLSEISFPIEAADTVDWDKIAKALKDPPRTDFKLTVGTFQVFAKGSSTRLLEDWCGHPVEFKLHGGGPGIHQSIYRLADGSRVFDTGGERVESIRHEGKDGRVAELVK